MFTKIYFNGSIYMSVLLGNTNQTPFTGTVFAFNTLGSFEIQETFGTIPLADDGTDLFDYDVTDAVQLLFSVRRVNDKIGITKDQSNNVVLQNLYYDTSSQIFTDTSVNVNTIYFDSDEFRDALNISSVISVGKLSTIYSDFNYTIMKYFGLPTELPFAQMFKYQDVANINNGIFDASAFIHLINGISINLIPNTPVPQYSVISDFSGYFQLNNVNNHLNTALIADASLNNTRTGMTDISAGFLDKDLLFILGGITVTLVVNITALPPIYGINTGPSQLNVLPSDVSLNYAMTARGVTKTTTFTTSQIKQITKVPILLKLTNIDTYNVNNFAQRWQDMTSPPPQSIDPHYWLSVSLSANGQYQTAIDVYGEIFTSNDYGVTWTSQVVIGVITTGNIIQARLSNYVAVSMTGQYQTAGNGDIIYKSNDYGVTWTPIVDTPDKQIYICVALNGQYQTVVSCNDNLYYSNDFGETWTQKYDPDPDSPDSNDELFNGILGHDSACMAISYDGRLQTIVVVSNYIYISNDFGNTFTKANIVFYDTNIVIDIFSTQLNWISVAMSADGKYQTALNNGGDIYRSTDYGVTFTEVYYPNDAQNINDRSWVSVTMSADGKYQMAVENLGGYVHYSTDYGVNWQISPPSLQTGGILNGKNFQSISISANGQYQSIAEYGGAIYSSNLL